MYSRNPNIIRSIFLVSAVLIVLATCKDKNEGTAPKVQTQAVSIHADLVTSGCTVVSAGSSPITAMGICWSTDPAPTSADNASHAPIGTYSLDALTVTPNIKYYIRAYATNSSGTSYGEQLEATLYLNFPDADVTDVDGNVYKTVRIGNQVWMKENLKSIHYRNGDPVPNVPDQNTWLNLSTGAYCDYNHDPAVSATYGRLYNSYVTQDPRKIAPIGWRIPSQTDFLVLTGFLGDNCRNHMMEAGNTHWLGYNAHADNLSGLTILPGGKRNGTGLFGAKGYVSNLWNSYSYAQFYEFGEFSEQRCYYFLEGGGLANEGNAIRCIKEE